MILRLPSQLVYRLRRLAAQRGRRGSVAELALDLLDRGLTAAEHQTTTRDQAAKLRELAAATRATPGEDET
jgi:hypothetical protein